MCWRLISVPFRSRGLKEEAQQVFEALEQGRRVLVSRHGHVVAAIDPPTITSHRDQLAAFAVRAPFVDELSASDINQGSPSEWVRRAEAGDSIMVTRRGAVVGVLGPPVPEETLERADAQEEWLVAFEAEHPDLTPDEFVAASMAAADASRPRSSAARAVSDDAVTEVIVDALLTKGRAHEASSDLELAESAFRSAIRFKEHPADRVRSKVAQSMVELAKVYTSEGRTPEAVELSDGALELLSPYVPAVKSDVMDPAGSVKMAGSHVAVTKDVGGKRTRGEREAST